VSIAASISAPGTALTRPDSPVPGWSLAAALLGFFVVTLDAVIVNVALPDIRRDLAGSMSGLQWVVDGYTLMFAALLLSAGSLSDRAGARRAFGAGMTVFVLASAACGLAPSLPALVAARFVQGTAAAAMMPSSMALISHAYPDPARRARAVTLWSLGGVAASTSGPVVGGLTYGAIEAGARRITAVPVLAAFAVAAAALTAFVVLQVRGTHPMLPLSLFRSRTVSMAVATGFAFMVGYYGPPFVMSLYLQQLRGLSALGTGVVFLPMMVTGGVLTPFIARLGERFGPRSLVITGLLAMMTGLTVIALLPVPVPVPALSLLMILVGLGGPLVMSPVMALLLQAVPARRAGIASGVFNTSRQAGGALAVAVFGALLATRATFLPGMRDSLLIAAAVALAAAAVSLLLKSARPGASPS
jgi:MFS transporter, DHA2 family, methylenomycin A resistance protein